jgi:hypothetical protein
MKRASAATGETLVARSKDEIVAEATRVVDSISINDPN